MRKQNISAMRKKAQKKVNRKMHLLFKTDITDSQLSMLTGIDRSAIFLVRKRYETKKNPEKGITMVTYFLLHDAIKSNDSVDKKEVIGKVTNLLKELFSRKEAVGLSDREMAKISGIVRPYICNLRNRIQSGYNATRTNLATYYALYSALQEAELRFEKQKT